MVNLTEKRTQHLETQAIDLENEVKELKSQVADGEAKAHRTDRILDLFNPFETEPGETYDPARFTVSKLTMPAVRVLTTLVKPTQTFRGKLDALATTLRDESAQLNLSVFDELEKHKTGLAKQLGETETVFQLRIAAVEATLQSNSSARVTREEFAAFKADTVAEFAKVNQRLDIEFRTTREDFTVQMADAEKRQLEAVAHAKANIFSKLDESEGRLRRQQEQSGASLLQQLQHIMERQQAALDEAYQVKFAEMQTQMAGANEVLMAKLLQEQKERRFLEAKLRELSSSTAQRIESLETTRNEVRERSLLPNVTSSDDATQVPETTQTLKHHANTLEAHGTLLDELRVNTNKVMAFKTNLVKMIQMDSEPSPSPVPTLAAHPSSAPGPMGLGLSVPKAECNSPSPEATSPWIPLKPSF